MYERISFLGNTAFPQTKHSMFFLLIWRLVGIVFLLTGAILVFSEDKIQAMLAVMIGIECLNRATLLIRD